MARRTLRRTSQLRGRTRRGRVRPRLGSHGCAAADGSWTCAAPRARRRVPTVPGGAARIGRIGGLHRDDAESGSYDQRGLLLTWCACTHAVSCVFVLAAWRHAYMHKSRCVLGFLHARHTGGSHVPNDAAKQGSHVAGCAAAYTHAGAAARCVSSNAAEHGSHVARCAPGSRELLCASTTAPYARTQE